MSSDAVYAEYEAHELLCNLRYALDEARANGQHELAAQLEELIRALTSATLDE